MQGINTANPDNNSNNNNNSEENSSSENPTQTSAQGLSLSNQRQHQLERTIKALVGRLEAVKDEMTKKDKLIGKYEKYYAQLKKEAERREGVLISERSGSTTAESMIRPASSSSSSSSSGLKTGQVQSRPHNTTNPQLHHQLQHTHYQPHQQPQQQPQQYPPPHRVTHSHTHAHHSNPGIHEQNQLFPSISPSSLMYTLDSY